MSVPFWIIHTSQYVRVASATATSMMYHISAENMPGMRMDRILDILRKNTPSTAAFSDFFPPDCFSSEMTYFTSVCWLQNQNPSPISSRSAIGNTIA